MFRKITLFFFMMIILSSTACSKQDSNNTNSKKTEQTTENVAVQADSLITTLFNENNVSLQLSSVDETNLSFSIVNQGEQSLTATCHGIAINSIMTPAFMMEDVKSGETKTVAIPWNEYATFCNIQEPEDIKSITLDFTCTNGKDEVLLSCQPKTYSFDNSKTKTLLPKEAKEVYNENDFVISTTPFSKNSDGQTEKEIYITNNSKSFCSVEFMNALLNKSDFDCFTFSEIYPGCTFKTTIPFDQMKPTDIKEFSVDIVASDIDYNELFYTTIVEKK